MDALMLEINTRGLHRYHKLEQTITNIGRAIDNDIILSDPTVAPYHLRITRGNDSQISLKNLADVNPARINNIEHDQFDTTRCPIKLQLGRVVATILSSNHNVAATRKLAGHGRSLLLFKHSGWAILLPIVCLLVGGLQFYLNSFSNLKWDVLAGYVVRETAVNLALLILVLSVVERLLVNRWEVRLVTICVSFTYLLFQLCAVLVDETRYMLSSQWPSTLFNIGWYLCFIPAIIAIYLINISHFKARQGILLAILISSPFSIPKLLNDPISQNLTNAFRSSADYHKSLSPLNWHLSETISIEKFVLEAEKLEAGQFVD